MKSAATLRRTSRKGEWLPADTEHLRRWLGRKRRIAKKLAADWHPVVREFQSLIESDPIIRMYFTTMFEQQPIRRMRSSWGDAKLKNYAEMLEVLNHILTTAPEYNHTAMVGFPINAILDYPMITRAGLAAFADARVSAMFRRVLIVWAEFLNSERSLYVLNDSATGWLSPDARRTLDLDAFEMDRAAPNFGFKSWNDFFIRKFKPGQRPIASPGNPRIIVNACESAAFAIRRRVRKQDEFWIKTQPYSLSDMLAGSYVDRFEGGTIYQAFLSAKNYHRWHSPVSGKICKLQKIPGTYYAEAASVHFDPSGPNDSQGYIAHTATRALIFIESPDPVGLVCLVTVGMAEVSSCVFEGADGHALREGQRVNKGDQVGYFQFGGSTHCLVFGPHVRLRFAHDAHPKGNYGCKSRTLKVNSHLATVV